MSDGVYRSASHDSAAFGRRLKSRKVFPVHRPPSYITTRTLHQNLVNASSATRRACSRTWCASASTSIAWPTQKRHANMQMLPASLQRAMYSMNTYTRSSLFVQAIHELALLATYYGVTVDNIASVVPDAEYSSCLTLTGPSGKVPPPPPPPSQDRCPPYVHVPKSLSTQAGMHPSQLHPSLLCTCRSSLTSPRLASPSPPRTGSVSL